MVIMLKQNHKQKKTFSRRSRGFLRQMFNMRFNSKKFVTKDFEKHFAEVKGPSLPVTIMSMMIKLDAKDIQVLLRF